ncbi:MAG: galactokinase [Gammaproteobacteria bacterium]|nr:galactokinase [Gammaproteobacteria bacterium]
MSGLFRQRYGREPACIARAPGRVNLIGEHVDYNGGRVLPMAIERETCIAVAPNGSRRVHAHSAATTQSVSIDLGQPLRPQPGSAWANYLLGVLAGFIERGFDVPGFDAVIESSVPPGSGLSSSAALEVAFATAIEGLLQRTLDPRDKAALCWRAEQEYAGVPCGPMDQMVVALGRAGQLLSLDCDSGVMDWVEFSDPAIALLVIDTGVRHALADGEYRRRREQCQAVAARLGVALLCRATHADLEAVRAGLEPLLYRRARHVLSEQQRTLAAIRAIRSRDWEAAGVQLYASHASLRDDFEVSCRELDALVEAARALGRAGGVYGCRMTGGGFGGCAVALVDAARAVAIGEAIVTGLRAAAACVPQAFVTRAAGGATLLRTQT